MLSVAGVREAFIKRKYCDGGFTMSPKIQKSSLVTEILMTENAFFFAVTQTDPKRPGQSLERYFLYDDSNADVIDPTILVRRSWQIGLVEKALVNGLQTIVHSDLNQTLLWPFLQNRQASLVIALDVAPKPA
jgi:hypothetical protein